MPVEPERLLGDLRALAKRTANERGSQRAAARRRACRRGQRADRDHVRAKQARPVAHTEEDTDEADLALALQALDRLVRATLAEAEGR